MKGLPNLSVAGMQGSHGLLGRREETSVYVTVDWFRQAAAWASLLPKWSIEVQESCHVQRPIVSSETHLNPWLPASVESCVFFDCVTIPCIFQSKHATPEPFTG